MPVVEAAVVHHDVCAEHRQVGRDLRRVQVMHVEDVRQVEDVRPDAVEVEPLRGRFQ